jgi:pyruvate dehydrogenase (quinone)
LLGNVKDTLDAGLPSIREKTDPSYLSEALRDYKKTRLDLDALAESSPHSDIIHPQYITRLVSELTAEDAIFTCDGGGLRSSGRRYLKVNGSRRIVGSFNHGSMANAMRQPIGARATYPGHLNVR